MEYEIPASTLTEYTIEYKVKDATSYGLLSQAPIMGLLRLSLANYNPHKPFDKWLELQPPTA